MTLNDYKDVATILGVVITTIAVTRGLIEYSYQGKQKRAEHFFNLRRKLKEGTIFKEICQLIETDSVVLKNMPIQDKRDFLGLFEEIAIMKKSGLVKPEITFYMFGYYAIKCWESGNFWTGLNKESVFWKVFSEFCYESKLYAELLTNKSSSQIEKISI